MKVKYYFVLSKWYFVLFPEFCYLFLPDCGKKTKTFFLPKDVQVLIPGT